MGFDAAGSFRSTGNGGFGFVHAKGGSVAAINLKCNAPRNVLRRHVMCGQRVPKCSLIGASRRHFIGASITLSKYPFTERGRGSGRGAEYLAGVRIRCTLVVDRDCRYNCRCSFFALRLYVGLLRAVSISVVTLTKAVIAAVV